MPKEKRQEDDGGGPYLSRRERLADRFGNWPLLRLLIYSFWFRLAFLGMLGVMLTLALMLPKVWRVTPAGFRPEVKARLLDFVQAWSLRRTAVAQEGLGNYPAAFSAWRAAWGYNLASQDTIRSLLAVVPKLEQAENQMGTIVQAGKWLGNLDGGTNMADIELIARAWVRSGQADFAAGPKLLGQYRDAMPPRLEQLYLMALFEAQRTAEFASRMRTNAAAQAEVARVLHSPSSPQMDAATGEPDFPLFCAAYLMSFKDEAARSKGLEVLRAARTVRGTETLAYDLEFIVANANRDAETCGEILRQLKDIGRTKIRQYTDYWRLLLDDGRKDVAVSLLHQANLSPLNAADAYRLAKIEVDLGLDPEAETLLQRFTENVSWASSLMVLQGDVLERAGKWDELRALALRIRLQPDSMEQLGAYSHYLEGLAAWHTSNGANRREAARESFQQTVKVGFSTNSTELALKVAAKLLTPSMDGAVWAEPILLSQRDPALTNEPPQWQEAYWQALMMCADKTRHDGYLMETASNYWRLRPKDAAAINNYAYTLLVFRQQPEDAITLTLGLVRDHPRDVDMQLNHAAALALNDRVQEADDILKRVNPNELKPALAAQYYLTRLEVYWKTKRPDLARSTAARIDPGQLYPVQATWLTNALQQLDTAQPAPAGKGTSPGP